MLFVNVILASNVFMIDDFEEKMQYNEWHTNDVDPYNAAYTTDDDGTIQRDSVDDGVLKLVWTASKGYGGGYWYTTVGDKFAGVGFDASSYEYLVMKIRCEGNENFVVGLKDMYGSKMAVPLFGEDGEATDPPHLLPSQSFQIVKIKLSYYSSVVDLSNLWSIYFGFNMTREGTIYLDEIYFLKDETTLGDSVAMVDIPTRVMQIPPGDAKLLSKFSPYKYVVPGVYTDMQYAQMKALGIDGNFQVKVTLSKDARLVVRIYDISGRIVRELTPTNGIKVSPGTITFEWDGKFKNGYQAPVGVYFVLVKVKAGNYSRVFRERIALVR